MANVYHTVLADLGLSLDNSGSSQNFDLMALLLTLAGDLEALNPVADTYPSDPYKELVHRLRMYTGHGVDQIRKVIVPKVK